MPVFTAGALVLRTFPTKNASLVVRLFTSEFGKITGFARRAQKTRSPMAGRLEILSLGEIKGYRNPRKELCQIDSISTLEIFPTLRSSLEGFYALNYIAELLDEMFLPDEAHPQFFALVLKLLMLLEHKAASRDLLLRYLEIQLLSELGYSWSFDASPDENSHDLVPVFHPEEGAFHFSPALRCPADAVRLSRPLLELIRNLHGSEVEDLLELRLQERDRRLLEHLCHRALLWRLERPLRSARFLQELDDSAPPLF